MFNKRSQPPYKVSLSSGDKFIEGLTLAILLLMWGYVFFVYPSARDKLAAGIGGSGDEEAHKSRLWILPALATAMYLFMTAINNYPQVFNYIEEITPKNIKQQYTMGTRIIRILKLVVLCTFAAILIAVSNGV